MSDPFFLDENDTAERFRLTGLNQQKGGIQVARAISASDDTALRR